EFIRTNSGKSYRQGLELLAVAKLAPKWQVQSNLTLSSNRNIDFKVKTAEGVLNMGQTPISFSPQFLANLALHFEPSNRLGFVFQNQWVGSQFLDNSGNNSLKTDAYLLSDFNARYEIPLKRSSVELKLLINN